MLFINDHKAEILKFYCIFYQGVGSDKYMKLSAFEALMESLPCLF